MSASSKKKLRKEQNAELLTERQRKEQAEAKKLKVTTIIFVVIMAVVVVTALAVMAVSGVKSSGILEKTNIVATIGEHKINAVEANYYFSDVLTQEYSNFSNMMSMYGGSVDGMSYASMMGLDPNLPLTEQMYDDQTSWADYYMQQAMDQAANDYVLYDEAMKNGFKLSEEDQASVDNMLANLEMYAMFNGVSTNDYLKNMYGAGSSVKSYTKYIERATIASAYYNSLTYDDAAIREFEADKYNDFSSFSYASYNIPISKFEATEDTATEDVATEEAATEETATEETATEEAATEEAATEEAATEEAATEEAATEEAATEEAATEETATEETATEETTTEDAAAQAKKVAESLKSATNVEELDAAIAALEINAEVEGAHSSKTEYAMYTSISETYRDWLANAERKENDIEIFASESTSTVDGKETTTVTGYTVIMFLEACDNTQPLGNVRHLLVKHEHVEGEEHSEDDLVALKAEADGYLKTWLEGDKTQDSFIALVKEHSDDTSAADGGLFENIGLNSTLVPEFQNWATDPNRKAGDAEVIETEYGYHVMYYVGGSDMTCRDELICKEIAKAWREDAVNAAKVTILDSSRINFEKVFTIG